MCIMWGHAKVILKNLTKSGSVNKRGTIEKRAILAKKSHFLDLYSQTCSVGRLTFLLHLVDLGEIHIL